VPAALPIIVLSEHGNCPSGYDHAVWDSSLGCPSDAGRCCKRGWTSQPNERSFWCDPNFEYMTNRFACFTVTIEDDLCAARRSPSACSLHHPRLGYDSGRRCVWAQWKGVCLPYEGHVGRYIDANAESQAPEDHLASEGLYLSPCTYAQTCHSCVSTEAVTDGSALCRWSRLWATCMTYNLQAATAPVSDVLQYPGYSACRVDAESCASKSACSDCINHAPASGPDAGHFCLWSPSEEICIPYQEGLYPASDVIHSGPGFPGGSTCPPPTDAFHCASKSTCETCILYRSDSHALRAGTMCVWSPERAQCYPHYTGSLDYPAPDVVHFQAGFPGGSTCPEPEDEFKCSMMTRCHTCINYVPDEGPDVGQLCVWSPAEGRCERYSPGSSQFAFRDAIHDSQGFPGGRTCPSRSGQCAFQKSCQSCIDLTPQTGPFAGSKCLWSPTWHKCLADDGGDHQNTDLVHYTKGFPGGQTCAMDECSSRVTCAACVLYYPSVGPDESKSCVWSPSQRACLPYESSSGSFPAYDVIHYTAGFPGGDVCPAGSDECESQSSCQSCIGMKSCAWSPSRNACLTYEEGSGSFPASDAVHRSGESPGGSVCSIQESRCSTFLKWDPASTSCKKLPRVLIYTWCTEDQLVKFENEGYWKSCYAHAHGFDLVFTGGYPPRLRQYLKSRKYDYVFFLSADSLLQMGHMEFPVWAWDQGHDITVMDEKSSEWGMSFNAILFKATDWTVKFLDTLHAHQENVKGNGPYMETILTHLSADAEAHDIPGYNGSCWPGLVSRRPVWTLKLPSVGIYAKTRALHSECFFKELDRLVGPFGNRNSKHIGFSTIWKKDSLPWANCWGAMRILGSKCFLVHWNGFKAEGSHNTVRTCPDATFNWDTASYNPNNPSRPLFIE